MTDTPKEGAHISGFCIPARGFKQGTETLINYALRRGVSAREIRKWACELDDGLGPVNTT